MTKKFIIHSCDIKPVNIVVLAFTLWVPLNFWEQVIFLHGVVALCFMCCLITAPHAVGNQGSGDSIKSTQWNTYRLPLLSSIIRLKRMLLLVAKLFFFFSSAAAIPSGLTVQSVFIIINYALIFCSSAYLDMKYIDIINQDQTLRGENKTPFLAFLTTVPL